MIQLERELRPEEFVRLSRYKGSPDGSHDNISPFSVDLSEIRLLQAQFENALSLPHDPNDLLHRSYNPVIDRWHIEKLRREGNKTGETAFIREIRRNWEKNLRERLLVSDSVIRYRISGEHLYSEDFPDEPFSDVLGRGAEYRLKNGTPEPEREGFLGERGGFEKSRKKFTDPKTAIGTKKTSLSPHGIAENTAYEGDYIDELELTEDTNGRFVRLTRTAVDLDYEGFAKTALDLDPHFFDDYDGRPLDAWFLSHPIDGRLLTLRKKGMADERFERIWNGTLLQGLIDDYVREVTADEVNWWNLSRVFNTILNQADKKESLVNRVTHVTREIVQRTINALGLQTPREVSGAGCPTNKGINLTGVVRSLVEKYQGSVAKFAGKEKECECADKSDNHYHCPGCWKKYADETHKAERTKECECGFKFNC